MLRCDGQLCCFSATKYWGLNDSRTVPSQVSNVLYFDARFTLFSTKFCILFCGTCQTHEQREKKLTLPLSKFNETCGILVITTSTTQTSKSTTRMRVVSFSWFLAPTARSMARVFPSSSFLSECRISSKNEFNFFGESSLCRTQGRVCATAIPYLPEALVSLASSICKVTWNVSISLVAS